MIPSDLIDLQKLKELKGIVNNNDNIEIGALCTHNEVASSNFIKKRITLPVILIYQ